MYLETLVVLLGPNLNFQKKEDLSKLDRLYNVAGRINICLVSFFSVEFEAERTNFAFPKPLLGGYLFVLAEYLCNRSPKMRAKHFKNYILISLLQTVEIR